MIGRIARPFGPTAGRPRRRTPIEVLHRICPAVSATRPPQVRLGGPLSPFGTRAQRFGERGARRCPVPCRPGRRTALAVVRPS